MIQIIVLLEVADHISLKAYESQAVTIMHQYGGALVAAFTPNIIESSDGKVGEIHILEFPSLAAFKNYRADPALQALGELRNKAIVSTAVYVADKMIQYD